MTLEHEGCGIEKYDPQKYSLPNLRKMLQEAIEKRAFHAAKADECEAAIYRYSALIKGLEDAEKAIKELRFAIQTPSIGI